MTDKWKKLSEISNKKKAENAAVKDEGFREEKKIRGHGDSGIGLPLIIDVRALYR